jgi:hypothetical protein
VEITKFEFLLGVYRQSEEWIFEVRSSLSIFSPVIYITIFRETTLYNENEVRIVIKEVTATIITT